MSTATNYIAQNLQTTKACYGTFCYLRTENKPVTAHVPVILSIREKKTKTSTLGHLDYY